MTLSLWLHNIAAWSAQAAILIAAAGLAAWAFRLRAPKVRMAHLQAVLALCLVLPALEPRLDTGSGHVDIAVGSFRPASPDRASGHTLPWKQALFILIVAGCAVRLSWLAVGLKGLQKHRRASQRLHPVPDVMETLRCRIAPQSRFLISPHVSGPVTFGFRQPVIVLPEGFIDLPPALQESVACHELLHVRRHDWIATVLEECVRAVFWFHPAMWWLISQIQLAREERVDRAVVDLTNDRVQYVNALLAMAVGHSPDLAPATMFLKKRHLKKRVALLVKEGRMSKKNLVSFCAASAGVLLAAGWLTVRVFPLQAAPAPQDTQSNLLHSVAPIYPAEALEKHIEGDVLVDVQIDAKGNVADARVLSGPEELRNAALQAVLQWHYSPTAMSLPAVAQATVNFHIPQQGEPEMTVRSSETVPQGWHGVLQAIRVEGLPESTRDELAGKLPVHVGDSLDAAMIQSLNQSVHTFDNHLNVSLAEVGPGQMVVRIFLPGKSDDREGNAQSPKIRVGGNIQQTKLLVKQAPIYPPEAKAQGIQGLVRLEATIGKDGRIENLVLVSGEPVLAAAAMEAVRNWQYATTLLNGDPAEVVTTIDVNFTLSK